MLLRDADFLEKTAGSRSGAMLLSLGCSRVSEHRAGCMVTVRRMGHRDLPTLTTHFPYTQESDRYS